MDELHEQVATLDRKLDSLYQAIEILTERIAIEEASQQNGQSFSVAVEDIPRRRD